MKQIRIDPRVPQIFIDGLERLCTHLEYRGFAINGYILSVVRLKSPWEDFEYEAVSIVIYHQKEGVIELPHLPFTVQEHVLADILKAEYMRMCSISYPND